MFARSALILPIARGAAQTPKTTFGFGLRALSSAAIHSRAGPTSSYTNRLRPRIRTPSSTPATSTSTADVFSFTFSPLGRSMSTETRSAIEAAVKSAPVVLFMKGTPEFPQCGFSRTVIQILGLQGVDPEKFHAFNVLEDPGLREGVKEFSDWPTIPQLYVENEFIGGCDILVQMHQKGELAKLFEEKNVLALEEEEVTEGEKKE